MLKTEVVKGELPYRIEIDNLRGAGVSPISATIAALSAGKRIPSGLRDPLEVASYLFWNYDSNPGWARLIHILYVNSFEEER